MGNFPTKCFETKDWVPTYPMNFLWNGLFHRDVGGILPRGWTSWKASFVSLPHQIPVFFMCSVQTSILAVSCVSSIHRIRDVSVFYSYVFPIHEGFYNPTFQRGPKVMCSFLYSLHIFLVGCPSPLKLSGLILLRNPLCLSDQMEWL